MACEVPGNASRGLEKRSAVQGGFPVAEAKVQATTSLPLHGMAGLYGLRPAPAMPGEQEILSRKRFPTVGRGIGSPGQLPDPS